MLQPHGEEDTILRQLKTPWLETVNKSMARPKTVINNGILGWTLEQIYGLLMAL